MLYGMRLPSVIYSVLCFQERILFEINFNALYATRGYFILYSQ